MPSPLPPPFFLSCASTRSCFDFPWQAEHWKQEKQKSDASARDANEKLRKLEARLSLGKRGEWLAQRNADLKAQVRTLQEEKERIDKQLHDQNAQLDRASDEMRGLVEALEIRGEEIVGGGDDGRLDTEAEHGPMSYLSSLLDRDDNLASLAADISRFPTPSARKVALLFEVGKHRAQQHKLQEQLRSRDGAFRPRQNE